MVKSRQKSSGRPEDVQILDHHQMWYKLFYITFAFPMHSSCSLKIIAALESNFPLVAELSF